tara:strand:- start:4062 stop:4220 length:159 start_codon:yes stop_codon:yes gene_type:complete
LADTPAVLVSVVVLDLVQNPRGIQVRASVAQAIRVHRNAGKVHPFPRLPVGI